MITKTMLMHRRDDSLWNAYDKVMFDLALYADNIYYNLHLKTTEEKQYALLHQLYQLEQIFGKDITQPLANYILDDFDKAEAELKNIMDMYREVRNLNTEISDVLEDANLC